MSSNDEFIGWNYFRKKPIVIKAIRFTTNNEVGSPEMDRIVRWIIGSEGRARHDRTDIYIQTLEGEMRASVGDWIIQGVKGEFYPCKHDIFNATYEAAIVEGNTRP